MKTTWYAIQAKRTTLTNCDPLYLQKTIKPMKKYGQTVVLDEDGKQYHLFKATKLDRVFIFFKLLKSNFADNFTSFPSSTLVIRRFKPYGKHLILENRIQGESIVTTIYYDV